MLLPAHVAVRPLWVLHLRQEFGSSAPLKLLRPCATQKRQTQHADPRESSPKTFGAKNRASFGDKQSLHRKPSSSSSKPYPSIPLLRDSSPKTFAAKNRVSTGVVRTPIAGSLFDDGEKLAVYTLEKVLLPYDLFGPRSPASSPPASKVPFSQSAADVAAAAEENREVAAAAGLRAGWRNLMAAIECDCNQLPRLHQLICSIAAQVNSYGNVVYDEYVRPMERIIDFRTRISGIRPRNMKKAKDFWEVQDKVAELIKGKVLVGHALHYLKVLLLSHPKKDIRDTSEYEPLRRGNRTRALKHLAEILGVNIQENEHCPIEDARAAMFIYMKYKKEWEKSMKKHFKVKAKLNKRKNGTVVACPWNLKNYWHLVSFTFQSDGYPKRSFTNFIL